MKKRQHRATSKEAHESIKEHKSALYQKIIKALEDLKVGGTFEEISKAAGLKPEQVWKRLSEMGDKIYTVGITRSLSSGRKGLVWQLKGRQINEGDKPITEKQSVKKQVAVESNPLFS